MNTRRMFSFSVIAILVVLLQGCDIYVYSEIDAFRVESARYQSEYTYNGTSVMCDDRTTEIEVVLRYRGEIDHVSISLVGVRFGERESLSSFSPSSNENEEGLIRRTVNVRSRLSPLGIVHASGDEEVLVEARDSVSPQSIIVVPVNPTIVGHTMVEVRVESAHEDIVYTSQGIPVLNFCN